MTKATFSTIRSIYLRIGTRISFFSRRTNTVSVCTFAIPMLSVEIRTSEENDCTTCSLVQVEYRMNGRGERRAVIDGQTQLNVMRLKHHI